MGETPGPIPNPEAKTHSADGTAPGRVWESRTPPDIHYTVSPDHDGRGSLHLKPIRHLAIQDADAAVSLTTSVVRAGLRVRSLRRGRLELHKTYGPGFKGAGRVTTKYGL